MGSVLCLLFLPVLSWTGLESVGHNTGLFFSSTSLVLLGLLFLFFVSSSNYFNIVVVANSGIVTKEMWRCVSPHLHLGQLACHF